MGMNNGFRFLVAAAVLVFAVPADAQTLSTGTEQTLRDQLRQSIESARVAGAMHLVFKDGKEVFFDAAGYRDIDDKLPMQRDTIVRIYSMTKPITSVAAMTLWEQDKFELDDPIAQFIPAFKQATVLQRDGEQWKAVPPKRPITVRDAFRHTTGYGYGGGGNPAFESHYKREQLGYRPPIAMMPPAMTIRAAADALARVPAFHHPGERFTYGFSTDLLGRLIEVWSGQPLDEYMEQAVFEPLEMSDTGFSVRKENAGRFASCHSGGLSIIDKAATSPFVDGFEFLSGGGGLISTIDDYAKFCQMMVSEGRATGKQILRPRTVEMMFTDQLQDTSGDFRFGLGFAIADITIGRGKGQRKAKQPFWAGYASTDFRLVPEENLFQIFIRQTVPSQHGLAKEQIDVVYSAIE
jgi:CubicO group peptidase (beta-lactamase class C family)